MKYLKQYKIFEKIKTFNVKGENISLDLEYNKIMNLNYVYLLDLSYNELVDSGIWKHIVISQRENAIGTSYNFSSYHSVDDSKVKKCIGQEVLCFNDKAGPFGGKPTITEGKLYTIYDYNEKTQNIKIKNDNNNFIQITPLRFCKTQLNVDLNKYNI